MCFCIPYEKMKRREISANCSSSSVKPNEIYYAFLMQGIQKMTLLHCIN